MAIERLEPQPENSCFGCGGANARGMKLVFDLDREQRRSTARVTLEPDLQGSGGMAHGGIIALLLDEAMGKLNRLDGVRAVTAEMTIEYLRPVPTGEPIEIEGEAERREGRNLFTRGEIRNAGGKPLARARARFVVIAERSSQAGVV